MPFDSPDQIYEQSRRVECDDVTLAVTDHGPKSGVPVLMLHGWPDSARLWRHQVPALAEQGYRVLAPDLRGFGRSDKPTDVEAYRIAHSVSDMLAILDEAGAAACHVVGHDFGALVAWSFAIHHPERVTSLTALSVGHPSAFASAGLGQLRRSWYTLLFQFEGVAEQFLSSNDWAMFRRLTGDHPETPHWIADLSRPGALTASLNWYRANSHPRNLVGVRAAYPVCSVPTQGVWSAGDVALTEHQMTGSEDHVTSEWSYRRLENASHWIPLDAPEELSSLLIDWFRRF